MAIGCSAMNDNVIILISDVLTLLFLLSLVVAMLVVWRHLREKYAVKTRNTKAPTRPVKKSKAGKP